MTDVPIRLFALVGSLRKASLTRALTEHLQEHLPAGVTMDIFERLADVPHFNPDLKADQEPEVVHALKEGIRTADGLLFATPEYNYSIPGVLKNAIDWASRPPATSVLRNKPAGIIGVGAGLGGSIRAQAHLRQIFHYTETHAMLQPEVLVARGHERFDANRRITDPVTLEILTKFGVALAAWVRRMK